MYLNPQLNCKCLHDLHYDNKITFIDLAGHEKYLKTTMLGLTGLFVDYGIVVIGANTGITRLTREHLGILLYLNIPIIIVITKIDIAPEGVYKTTVNKLRRLLTRGEFGKKLFFINDDEEKATEEVGKYLNTVSKNNSIIPVISISNKIGTNIENLHAIIKNLKPIQQWDKDSFDGSLFYIDSTFKVPGIGLVVSGTLKGQDINVNQKLWLGPVNGKFVEIRVRSLHNSIREDVKSIYDSENSCIALKFVSVKDHLERNQLKKGMIIISNLQKYKKNVVKKFKAKIRILHHSTTIVDGYKPVIHCGPIRQAASINIIQNDDKDKDKYLRTGDKRCVIFTFAFNPEFVEEGTVFFFRDGTTKGVGEVIELIQ